MAIILFKSFSDRMCFLEMREKFQKFSFFNHHAPTEDAGIKSIKMVLVDANTKRGKEEEFRMVIEMPTKHDKTNENVPLLVDFVKENN